MIPGLDKIVHVGVFALTVWAVARVLPRDAGRPTLAAVVGIALVHAVLIEVVQGVVLPGRSGSAGDVLADAAGIALGLALWALERRIRA